MEAVQGPIKIFVCYAREDEPLLRDLEKHLRLLQRKGLIEVWHDREISPGANWEQEIEKQLHAAHIILFLVSPDFINSDYCWSIEMQQAMERHRRGNVCIIPVILRPISWQDAPFGKLQALPVDAKPVTGSEWRNREEALENVAEGLRKIVMELRVASPKTQTATTMRPFTTPATTSAVPQTAPSTPSFHLPLPQSIQTRLRQRRSGLSIASIVVFVFALVLMGISTRVLLSGSPAGIRNTQNPQQATVHGQTTSPSTPLLTPPSTLTPTQDLFTFPLSWKKPTHPVLFSAGAGWEIDNTTPGCSYDATTGTYQATSSGLNGCIYEDSSADPWTDVGVRMEVSILSGQWAGFAIRLMQNNYYLFQINVDGKFRFMRHDAANGGDDFRVSGKTYSVTFAHGIGQWVTLQIVARGPNFYLSINSQPAFAGTDPTWSKGTIGVVTGFGDNTSCTAQFRNVQVVLAP